MANLFENNDFAEYFTQSQNPSTIEQKNQFSPNSNFLVHSQRLKCFTDFTNSPELKEEAFLSNTSTTIEKSQEVLKERSQNLGKSYDFTYKILFNTEKTYESLIEKENEIEENEMNKTVLEHNETNNFQIFMEIHSKKNNFCLCGLSPTNQPSRNIRVNNPKSSFEVIYSLVREYGEVINIETCNFPCSFVICFDELEISKQMMKMLSTQFFNLFGSIEFIPSLNESYFADCFILTEKFEKKNQDFETFFSLFGLLSEVTYFKTHALVRYNSLKSLKKLEKCLENFKNDSRSQLKFLKNIFLNMSEDFLKHLLSKVLILTKENCSDFLLQPEKAMSTANSLNDLEANKENCRPNCQTNHNLQNFNSLKNRKKPLKLTSSVFSLSEISSVNDVNNSNLLKQNSMNESDHKSTFIVDLDLIKCGLEKRTTIMIRNIPNRYNQESLLMVIDVKFKGMYDFIYLPMDFKNKCNIGYAFVNFISTKCILDFYLEFHNKRWDLLRSEKICCICFARIQGRNQLIKHFKKSNVIHLPLEKNYKPLILPNPLLDSPNYSFE